MATDAERGGFTSRFRKTDRFENRRDRGERRSKALDQNENTSTERETVTTTASSRSRHSGITTTTTREPGSVAARISRLKLDDEIKKEKEEEEKEVPKPNDTKIDTKHADAASEEDHTSKKTVSEDTSEEKKSKERGASGTTSKKRQQKKNLREKRRSTGVVIMPSTAAEDDEETKQAKENAVQNEVMVQEMSQNKGKSSRSKDGADEAEKQQLIEQLEAYQQAIQEWRDEYNLAQKEIDTLKNENQRLRDENSALVKVVNQLSGGSRK